MISVIVPVYKVEDYLDQCVQSIVSQTYTDLEIILVDDGSPDNCPAICDAWAGRDSRIKVIHKENGGAADARNIGLSYAHGDFIAFVDSDDMIHATMYQRLLEVLLKTKSDIVECEYITFEGNYTIQPKPIIDSPVCFSTEDALRLHIRDKAFKQVIWNKLY